MRILIYVEKADRSIASLDGTCADLFRKTDYRTIVEDIKKNNKGICTNIGNKVWLQGIISEVSVDNELSIYDGSESWNDINEKYDIMILSVANLINPSFKNQIQFLADEIKCCKIPVYVISIGAQADSFDAIDDLCMSVGRETKELIEAVYNTGGEIACRGYFTKEVFNKICKNTAEVVGCPSLYQNGRNISINSNKVSQENLKVVFNGSLPNLAELVCNVKDSVYIDQDTWFFDYYDKKQYEGKNNIKNIKMLLNKYGKTKCDLFFENRLRIFWDIAEWHNYLIDNGFNFSIGTKIHGTVMSILAGIPSVLLPVDSRTREMAEFYGIPFITPKEYTSFSFYEIYQRTDYSAFLNNFSSKFDKFNDFLVRNHIVKAINENNIFWNKESPIPNIEMERKKESMRHSYNIIKYPLKIKARIKQLKK